MEQESGTKIEESTEGAPGEFAALFYGTPMPPPICGRPAKTTGKPCRLRPHTRLSIACLRHMTTEEREEAHRLDREFAEQWGFGPQRQLTDEEIDAIVPACWGWPVPGDLDLLSSQHIFHEKGGDWCDEEIHSRTALLRWHEGRCAICAASPKLVEDHDHETGLVRGFLCSRCNTWEGLSKEETTGPIAKYRSRTPSQILGLRRLYRNPITGKVARPEPPREVADPWGKDNPLYGIGL